MNRRCSSLENTRVQSKFSKNKDVLFPYTRLKSPGFSAGLGGPRSALTAQCPICPGRLHPRPARVAPSQPSGCAHVVAHTPGFPPPSLLMCSHSCTHWLHSACLSRLRACRPSPLLDHQHLGTFLSFAAHPWLARHWVIPGCWRTEKCSFLNYVLATEATAGGNPGHGREHCEAAAVLFAPVS